VITLRQNGGDPMPIPLRIAIEDSSGRRTTSVLLSDTSSTITIPATTEPLSVRIDDGGYLPIRVVHTRTEAMLLYQLSNEPDTWGRIDALQQLRQICSTRACDDRVRMAIAERADHDPSRLVRQMAK
jgi:hypothetical protein